MKRSISIIVAVAILIGCRSLHAVAQQKSTAKKSATPATTKPPKAVAKDGYTKLPGGVEYKIFKDVPGKNAEIGQFIELNIVMKADTLVLKSSRVDNQGKPVGIPFNKSTQKGDFTTAFAFLSKGDSAVIRVSMDTIIAANPGQNLPPFIKKGKKVSFEVTVADIKTAEEYTKEMDAKKKEMQEGMKQQAQTDDKLLQDYFTSNSVKAEKTTTGLYYVIHKDGVGDVVKKGQKVSVKYTGKLLNGKIFDTNADSSKGHPDPFEFSVGTGGVIQGWDEGLTLLKKGSKATLYIPSPLAYGPRGAGADIGPNTVLIFDIEVLDVKEGK